MQTHSQYWEIIEKLSNTNLSKAQRMAIVKSTGVSKLPLCATSKAFLHPSSSPIDPFHLYYENIMTFIWDLWVSFSSPSEMVHLPESKARKFGEYVLNANKTLPPAFCGAIRDPYLKRQSQYKIYEWMALLHWYTIPIAIELNFNPSVLENFAKFAYIVEYTMSIQPRTDADLNWLHEIIEEFLIDFQRLYIGDDPTKINPTMERTLGQLGNKIRSRKAPFTNLANIIYEIELQRILALLYPERLSMTNWDSRFGNTIQQHKSLLTEWYLSTNISEDEDNIEDFVCWGCLHLPNGQTLRSLSSESKGNPPSRCSRWFENGPNITIFGEALAFYQVKLKSTTNLNKSEGFLIYRPIESVKKVLQVALKGKWSKSDCVRVINISDIWAIVGIWESPVTDSVYILRKHPTFEVLTAEE
ncbi:hypothetical protein BDQ17DRAFT_1186094, partial [Cyathus striatus]